MTDPLRAELFAVELRTDAFEAMVAWYRDVLGLRSLLRVVDDGYALLGAGTARIALVTRTPAGDPSDRVSLSFEIADLAAARERLAAAGAEVVSRPPSHEGFVEILTRDPDGNRLRLFSWGAAPT